MERKIFLFCFLANLHVSFAWFPVVVCTEASWSEEIKTVSGYYTEGTATHAPAWVDTSTTRSVVHPAKYRTEYIEGTSPGDIADPDPALIDRNAAESTAAAGQDIIVRRMPEQTAQRIDLNAAESAAVVAQAEEIQKSSFSSSMGDPVLLTTGAFAVADEHDLTLMSGKTGIDIYRSYLSSRNISLSTGRGWSLSTDSRIVSGMNLRAFELYDDVKAEYDVVSNIWQAKKEYIDANGIREELVEAERIVEELTVTIASLDSFSWPECGILASEARSKKEAYENHAGTLRTILGSFDAAGHALSTPLPLLESLKAEAEWSAENRLRNEYAIDASDPPDFGHTGNRTLCWIDESGIPHLYAIDAVPEMHSTVRFPDGSKNRFPSGSSTTPLVPHDSALYLNPDGRYIVTGKYGTQKVFSRYGLLDSVTDTNGHGFSFRYSPDGLLKTICDDHGREIRFEHAGRRISKIQGPENRLIRYSYDAQGLLASVTDSENDTVRYAYTDGLMTRIIKPDGSYIQLEYGYARADGTRLTTSTTHEENASERFDYHPDQKLTIHTNHSGVATKYWYDDSHRTVREEHADGTVITFRYDAATGKLDSETSNGRTTTYAYDARGNRESARYGDGSDETWAWNDLDQTTYYRDRDGIETVWAYDSKGNCTNVLLAGIQVFAGTYDGAGMLVVAKTGERGSERYSYDANGYLSTRTTGTGSDAVTETWTSDAIGRTTSYTDGGGRKTAYRYEGRNVIETGPAGLEKTYAYNNRKDLVSIAGKDLVTQETRETKITYDKRHLPVKMIDGEGIATVYAYREDGKMISETKGKWTSAYRYDPAGRPYETVKTMEGSTESHAERYEYGSTAAGEIRTVFLPLGRTSVYGYDGWNRMTSVTDALSDISERSLSPAGRLDTEQTASGGKYEYAYDDSGRLTGIRKENDDSLEITYLADGNIATKTDRNGNTTAYAYDGNGRLVLESTISGTTAYAYDASGRMTGEISSTTHPEEPGAGTYSTSWAYTSDGRGVTVTEGNLYPVHWTMNAWGEIVRKTDGEGNCFVYVFDKNGRLSAANDGYGNQTKYTWNAIGKVETITYADGSVETYGYNHLGLVTEISDALGTSWKGAYDSAGRLVRETGRPGIDREYAYDRLDRLTTVKSGGTAVETYSYSDRGRKIASVDGNGKSYLYEKDEFGVPTGETNRLGDSRVFEYDDEGRSINTKEFSDKIVTTEYDDAKNTVTTQYRDGSVTVIVKDATGRIVKATGASGTIRYRYDEGGMLVSQRDESADEETSYTYDKAGRRVRMDSGSREISLRYGKNGELLSVSDGKQLLKAAFTYDVMGRETSRTYGNGIVQETQYDEIGRAVMIRELSARRELLRAEGSLYDDQGRRSHSFDEKGNLTVYSYDNQSRLETVLYPVTPEIAAAAKADAEYSGVLDQADQGYPERYTIPSSLEMPIRNILDLVSVARGNIFRPGQTVWRESWTYDANGNRRTKTTPWGTIEYAYDAENRLVSMGDVLYAWDRDGNLMSEKSLRKTATYAYTDTNRMKTSIVSDLTKKKRTTTDYAYDAFGRRTLVKDTGSNTMRTLYDGLTFDVVRSGVTLAGGSFSANYTEDRISAAGTDAGSSRYRWIEDYSSDDRYRTIDDEGYGTGSDHFTGLQTPLYAKGESVAMNRIGSGKSSHDGAAYFGTDLSGSVRSATDKYGNIEDRFEYDAFGNPYDGDFTTGLNVGYTGKPYDAVTGMYNYGFRDYAPVTARFTTIDPIRDGNNWFVYVSNDPVNWMDPDGLLLTLVVDKEKQTLTATFKDGQIEASKIISITTAVVSKSKNNNNTTINEDVNRTQVTGNSTTHPTQFPNGKATVIEKATPSDSRFGNEQLRTNATQMLKNEKGELIQDGGYNIHYTPYSNTNGCIGVRSEADMKSLIDLYNMNNGTSDNRTQVIVQDKEKKNK